VLAGQFEDFRGFRILARGGPGLQIISVVLVVG
jgi:hypothetical protein